jgi:5-methylcytosine-specific restriction enzyme B
VTNPAIPNPLQAGLEAVLARYVQARNEPFGGQHDVAQLLSRLGQEFQGSAEVRKRSHVEVRASSGQGNWARVPWIAFLDARETNTTQQGVYPVILFCQDMSGFYLTLNQGVTVPLRDLGDTAGRKHLREKAGQIRAVSHALVAAGFRLDHEIDLKADTKLGSKYEDSTIAHKFYPNDAVPSDDKLLSDLDAVLESYDAYLEGKINPDQARQEEKLLEQPRQTPAATTSLAAVCASFASTLRNSHLDFGPAHDDLVRAFIASLVTKRFVILTGLSGSGKSQIAVKFGQWLGPGSHKLIAVRPDWTGPDALFGYEDALQKTSHGGRAWHVPEVLEFMLKAVANPQRPYALVLDEMNLAHVERYFADALSGMETSEPCLPNLVDVEGTWAMNPDGPRAVRFPTNLFVIGTVNVDETTYLFSPKVLDRANTFEFRVSTDDLSPVAQKPIDAPPGDPRHAQNLLEVATDNAWHLVIGTW